VPVIGEFLYEVIEETSENRLKEESLMERSGIIFGICFNRILIALQFSVSF
jgi:hypothetical protein